MKVSPAIMQTVIAKLFEGIPDVASYIDDIVMFANAEDGNVEQICMVLLVVGKTSST